MARTKRGVVSRAKHKKVLKSVKGQYGRRKNRFTKDRFIWSFNRGSIGVTRMGHRTFTVHRLSI